MTNTHNREAQIENMETDTYRVTNGGILERVAQGRIDSNEQTDNCCEIRRNIAKLGHKEHEHTHECICKNENLPRPVRVGRIDTHHRYPSTS